MSRALYLLIVTALCTVALVMAIAGRADAAMRRQTVRLPMSCYAYEADDDPDGEPIQVFAPAGMEYKLVTLMGGVTTVLATLPCSELPRTVTIGGAWPSGTVLGCVLDVCVHAKE